MTRRGIWGSAVLAALLVAVVVAGSAGADRLTSGTVKHSQGAPGGGPAQGGAGGEVGGGGGGALRIKHVVVIFQENASFDHYFGTYPNAANVPGQPRFVAAPGTPQVNAIPPSLLTANPNGAN